MNQSDGFYLFFSFSEVILMKNKKEIILCESPLS